LLLIMIIEGFFSWSCVCYVSELFHFLRSKSGGFLIGLHLRAFLMYFYHHMQED
jgi:hypothetical protein